MPKKRTAKQRTQVKDLPKRNKKLSTGQMKKVKGGVTGTDNGLELKNPSKPGTGGTAVVSLGKLG